MCPCQWRASRIGASAFGRSSTTVAEWFDLGAAVAALLGAVAALVAQHRTARRLRSLRRLAEGWVEQASFRREHGEAEAAGWLEYSAYWVLKSLAGDRG